MRLAVEIARDANAAAAQAAARIAAAARDVASARGVFTLAVSGGSTPARMLRALAAEDVPWARVHVFQVDERVAPEGHAERNLTRLRQALASAPLPPAQLHPMPVGETDLALAARAYERTIAAAGGTRALDLVHLGLGADGHTASLVPGDPVLEVTAAGVAATSRPYRGRRRMTLTYPALARARAILWLVTGAAKAPALARLLAGDRSIPAGRVRRDRALVIADRAAAGRPRERRRS